MITAGGTLAHQAQGYLSQQEVLMFDGFDEEGGDAGDDPQVTERDARLQMWLEDMQEERMREWGRTGHDPWDEPDGF